MDLQVTLNNETIELDNGHQYLTITVEEAQKLVCDLQEKIYIKNCEKNQEIDSNFNGGL
jgi:hypothetical protein